MKNYKHFISVVLAVALFVSMTFSVSANQPINVYINNEKIDFDVEPILMNDRTLVPMDILVNLGAYGYWDDNTITAFKGRKHIVVTIDSLLMDAAPQPVQLDTPAVIVDGTTMIPLRAVAEALGCEVLWDDATRSVNIHADDYIDYTQQTETQEIVYAATSAEFLNAIGNNRKIVLTSDYYSLSGLDSVNNENVEKVQNYDGSYLDSYIVENVVNMTIEGNAEITIDEKMADVLAFVKCGNITLSGLTMGHTTSYDEYKCEGAVLSFLVCENVTVENCNLYGCGAVGINASKVKNLNVSGGKIYDCTYTGIWLDSSDATVNKTEFSDSFHSSGFLRIDNSTITCTECNIHDIVCEEWAEGFVETLDWEGKPSEIVFTDCVFSDNIFKNITNSETKNLTFNNCIFNNNTGDMTHPAVVYNS